MSMTWAVSHLFQQFYCLLEKFAGSLHAGHYYGCSLPWWVFVHTCNCTVQVTQKEGKEKKNAKTGLNCVYQGGGWGAVVVQKRHLCDW